MNWYKLSQALARPARPSGSVRKRDVVKNPGTNTARQIIQYQFTTSLGNVVKVQMEPQGNDSYNIIFYVNDTMDDNAGNRDGVARDSEILPGVLYIMKDKAKRLGAKTLTFRAITGKGDTKVKRNVDPKPYLDTVLRDLRVLYDSLNNHKVTMVTPNSGETSVWKRLGIPSPGPRPDLDTKQVISYISNLTYALSNNGIERVPLNVINECEALVDRLYSLDLGKFGIDSSAVISSLKNLSGAIRSNTDDGWVTKDNRRANIYKKLMDRYFADEWDISGPDSAYFTLNRREHELV